MPCFPNLYYNVDYQYLSFVDDIDFKNYPLRFNVHEEILVELDRCNTKLNETRASVCKDGGELKSKVVYIAGCVGILYYFVLDHIPASGIDLICSLHPCKLGYIGW